MNNSSPNPETPKEEGAEEEQQREEVEERAKCDWDFTLSTIVYPSTARLGSDALGTIEFDPSDRLLATGGIARKIRIYSAESLLPCSGGGEDGTLILNPNGVSELLCICAPAKLSSLRWRPNSGGRVIGSGDYDGSVVEYDLERQMPVFERDEHGGHRIWSVDYSHWDPALGASGSDDGTAQLWDTRCNGGSSLATVRPGGLRSSVCCVEFNPFGGPLVVAGSTDRRAYGYDIRRMVDPVFELNGHGKPVTYVRFLDFNSIATAATDGSLKLWDMDSTRAIRTYTGHTNARNFVGLSVWRAGGLLGCGSESNQVFVYDKRWGEPIWACGLGPTGGPGSGHGFVSGVCWRQVGQDECALVAGGSDGVLQVFIGQRRANPRA